MVFLLFLFLITLDTFSWKVDHRYEFIETLKICSKFWFYAAIFKINAFHRNVSEEKIITKKSIYVPQLPF